MKTILLMRHAHAVSDNSAYSDHQRPLSTKGRKLARATAALLTEFPPDRIVCSSATRTQETSRIVADTIHYCGQTTSCLSLYLAPADAYVTVAHEELSDDDQTVLLIGHNPGLASLICTWAQESLAISPSTVAIFRADIDSWQALPAHSDRAVKLTGFISGGVRVK